MSSTPPQPPPQPSQPQLPQLLQGQVIGIIGASSGIGAAIAETLYGHGASLALGARRVSHLEKVAETCRSVHPNTMSSLSSSPSSGSTIFVHECDVTNRDSVQAFYDAASHHFHGHTKKNIIHALINVAGVMYFTKMKNANMDQWDQTIDVNCRGATNCMGVAIPQMLLSKEAEDATDSAEGGGVGGAGGKLIFITSDAGVRDFPNLAVYCASKKFVETLVEITRRELVGTGITLHTIQPGDVKGTELILQNTDREAAETMGVEIGKPVGEGFQRDQLLDPKDVAQAVVTVLTAPNHVAINSILIEPRDQE